MSTYYAALLHFTITTRLLPSPLWYMTHYFWWITSVSARLFSLLMTTLWTLIDNGKTMNKVTILRDLQLPSIQICNTLLSLGHYAFPNHIFLIFYFNFYFKLSNHNPKNVAKLDHCSSSFSRNLQFFFFKTKVNGFSCE